MKFCVLISCKIALLLLDDFIPAQCEILQFHWRVAESMEVLTSASGSHAVLKLNVSPYSCILLFLNIHCL